MTDIPESPEETAGPLAIVDALAPEGWRARATRAFVQVLMLGSRHGADAYLQAREVKDLADARTKINAMTAETIGRQALGDPVFLERRKAAILGDLYQKQDNKEAVLAMAAERLEQLPPPSAEEQAEDTAEPLNADWATVFAREAEVATSEELRDRLAKVLAGEITNPGTYSRTAVRRIAELEKADIKAFLSLMQYRLGDRLLIINSWPEGERITTCLPLEDLGLLSAVASALTLQLSANEEGKIAIAGHEAGLVMKGSANLKRSIGFLPLTSVGSAVAKLIDGADERALLRKLFEEHKGADIRIAGIGPLTTGSDGLLGVSVDELLLTEPAGTVQAAAPANPQQAQSRIVPVNPFAAK